MDAGKGRKQFLPDYLYRLLKRFEKAYPKGNHVMIQFFCYSIKDGVSGKSVKSDSGGKTPVFAHRQLNSGSSLPAESMPCIVKHVAVTVFGFDMAIECSCS